MGLLSENGLYWYAHSAVNEQNAIPRCLQIEFLLALLKIPLCDYCLFLSLLVFSLKRDCTFQCS